MSVSYEVELGNLIELGNSVENIENELIRGFFRNYVKYVWNVVLEIVLKRDWNMILKWY